MHFLPRPRLTHLFTNRLMEKDTDNLLVNPFKDDSSVFRVEDGGPNPNGLLHDEIVSAAERTVKDRSSHALPTEKEASSRGFYATDPSEYLESESEAKNAASKAGKDLQISLRGAIRGVVMSLVDSAPSEIAVLTLKNVNAIASWNIQRTTDATVFITVTSIQVDNMIPNSPFPVAVCVDEKEMSPAQKSDGFSSSKEETPPAVVLGLSFAPKHKTGIVVSISGCCISMCLLQWTLVNSDPQFFLSTLANCNAWSTVLEICHFGTPKSCSAC